MALAPKGETKTLLDDAPMSRPQIAALAVAGLLATLDGYDLLAMAFVAPAVSQNWSVSPATLGLLLAVSLIGMALGSLVLSAAADVVGRKPAVVAGLTMMVAGSLLSGLSQSVGQLAVWRALTGIGVGVMIALMTTVAAELANARRRPLAIAMISVGLPTGGLIGGLVAAVILRHSDWRSVFFSGALLGALLLPLVLLLLPESPRFLVARRPKNALPRLNRILTRFNQPALYALPPAPPVEHTSYRALFADGMAPVTIRLATVQMLISAPAYFMVNWLPQMVRNMGFPAATGSIASVTWNVLAILSGLLFGAIAARAGMLRLACFAMIGFGLAVALFGSVPPALPIVLLVAGFGGFFLGGSTAVLYATIAGSFPPLARASGVGLVMGAGRMFSFVGPSLGGWMFAQGMARSSVTLAFGVAPAIAGLLLLTFRRPRVMD